MPQTTSTHNCTYNIIRISLICYIAGIFSIVSSRAQNISIHHPQLQFLFEDSLLQIPTYHSALKPIEISGAHFDSVMGTNPPLNFILQNFPFRISPIVEATGKYNNSEKELLFRFGQGIYISGNIGTKAGFELSAILYEEKFPNNTSN